MKPLQIAYSHTYATTAHVAIDLSLSENPLGPSPKVIDAITKAAGKAHLYPDQEKKLIALIAQHHQIAEESILLGAGANQLLEDFLKVFALRKRIVVPSATFPESVACMSTLQGAVDTVSLHSNLSLDLDALLKACQPDTGFIHLCNPNNPTGIWTESSQLLQLADLSPVPLLISEAGADFLGQTIINRSFKTEDKAHYAYMRTQIAIIYYMHKYRNVGIKVGWICADSIKQINVHVAPHYLKQWDELKFDRWCEIVCQDSTMQYLYAKAGLKQSGYHKQISVSEGCPYTAYDKDRRYIIQTQNKQEIKTICSLQKRVASHWEGIASLCSRLIQKRAVDSKLLPEDCIKKAMLCSQSITCSISGQIHQSFQALQIIHLILPPATSLEANIIAKTPITLLT